METRQKLLHRILGDIEQLDTETLVDMFSIDVHELVYEAAKQAVLEKQDDELIDMLIEL